MATVVLLGVWLFVLTNIDTLIIVSAFCADNDYPIWEVFVGHYLGFTIGLIAAVAGSVLAAELLKAWSFLLGTVPLAIGLRGLFVRPPETSIEESTVLPNSTGRISVVTVAGIGLSGENLAVYIPFFIELSTTELLVMIGVYLAAAGILFLVALVAVYHVAVDGISDRLDRWLVPTVLVVVGGYVVLAGLFAV